MLYKNRNIRTPNYNTGALFEGGGVVTSEKYKHITNNFDVTDTTNCKDIDVDSIGSGNFFVGSSSYYAYIIIEFMKLGNLMRY